MIKPKPKQKAAIALHPGVRRRAEKHLAATSEFGDLQTRPCRRMYPNFAEAKAAWLGKAQATVDNAQMRYFVAHIHRLFEAEEHEPQQDAED